MLVSLLPGFRELRSPLAAGYLWLTAAWVLFQPTRPHGIKLPEEIQAIAELVKTANLVGVGIAVSFVAYLLGLLSVGLLKRPLLWLANRASPEVTGGEIIGSPSVYSRRGDRLLRTLVEEKWQRISREKEGEEFLELLDKELWHRNVVPPVPEDDSGEPFDSSLIYLNMVGNVSRDLDLITTRLLGNEPELHETIDRTKSEAEFRFAIIPPLTALIATLALRTSLLWFVGLAPLVVFLMQGGALRREAGDLIIDALFLGRVAAPSLEQMDRNFAEFRVASTEQSSPRKPRGRRA